MGTMLIIGAAFVGVACLVGGTSMLLSRRDENNAMEQRLDVHMGNTAVLGKKQEEPSLLASPLNDVPNAVEEFIKRFFNLRAFLQQADTQLTPARFLGLSVGIGVGTTVILPIIRVPIAAAPLGLILGFVPFAALYLKRKRRLAA